MSKSKLIKAWKMEKDANVAKRIHLVKMVKYDGRPIRQAAKELCMAPSWGTKWYKRYKIEGLKGLQNRPRSGRPPKVHRGIMSKVRQKTRETACWTLYDMSEHIREYTGVEYSESHVRRILAAWGYVMKVPVMRHANRANKRRIKKFQKQLKKTRTELEADRYTVAMQDETIVMAETRARKNVYTLKHKRAVFTYNGNHAMTIVLGLITANGEGFGRYEKFTKEEFTTFIQDAHSWFGKLLIILDGASQHRARIVRQVIAEMNGKVILKFLPPDCPDLNAIEEVWRQLKMAVLSGPHIKFGKMCNDIEYWLSNRLPSLNMDNFLYRVI